MLRLIGHIVAAVSVLMTFAPAGAQQVSAGQVKESVNGEVGQRQTRAQVAPNHQPLARIDTRIQNRVQMRLRNRIDRYYDPQADAASPFAAADDRARATRRQ